MSLEAEEGEGNVVGVPFPSAKEDMSREKGTMMAAPEESRALERPMKTDSLHWDL